MWRGQQKAARGRPRKRAAIRFEAACRNNQFEEENIEPIVEERKRPWLKNQQ
jgi:hypothetical protein